jgi:magnesium transporter
VRTITAEEVNELIEAKRFGAIKRALSEEYPVDLAEFLEEQPYERVVPLFRLLPKELAAETFVEMASDLQERLIVGFSDKELRSLLNEMYVDDTVEVIEEMPANVVKRILASAHPSMRKDINEILEYPKDSAGSIMTTEYIALRSWMTVSEAFESKIPAQREVAMAFSKPERKKATLEAASASPETSSAALSRVFN